MKRVIHPYEDLTGGEWLRGNLHTHTLQSDGADAPQVVIDDYAERGHDFLMISDHDILTTDEKYREWDSRGMIMIPGNEISANGPHLLHVDADAFVSPHASRQEVINEINELGRESGRGFAVVNHPNWGTFDHATITQMREWTGYIGLEICNGVISWLHGSPYATNKWDILLSEGRRLWGFANDDSHAAKHRGMGWNVAYVKEHSVASVIEALRNGRFYGSTGVVIKSITVEGDTIRLETENARRICALHQIGCRFQMSDGPTLEVKIPERAQYVRFECWGDGESFAWTQPFYVEAIGTKAADTEQLFLSSWQASPLLEHGNLADAAPEFAASRPTTIIDCFPPSHAASGFVDVRRITGSSDGIIYLSTQFESEQDGPRTLRFGFDGPVRVWVNGQEVFFGPGTNPAVRDAVSVYARFKRGTNDIVVALDTNGGKAYGIFARVE